MDTGTDIKYKRLTRTVGGARFSVAQRSRSSLWLGPDHILSIEYEYFRESYKRFYFRDIQAILVQKTIRFAVWNYILGVITLIPLIFTLAFLHKGGSGWTTDAGVTVFGIITMLFALISVVHLISGPTCKTFLRTAVQIEELPSLCRAKSTRRALAKIHPLIVAAQGSELSPEAIATQMREWTAPTATAAPPAGVEDDPNVPPRLNP